jgi:hypothetical protein
MSSHVFHDHFHDHEDALRAALSAAADGIEPGGDGLQRIQSRLRRPPRPLPIAWAQALWIRLSLRIPEGVWYALDRTVFALRAASERLMPAPEGRQPGHGGGRLAWLRPVTAMGVGVAVIAAVVYISINVTQVISPASSTGASTRAGGPGASASVGGGSAQTKTHSHGATKPVLGGPPKGAPTTSPPCISGPSQPASASPQPSTSGTASPSQSISPSQSPSASPSESVTPTPTVSASPSSTPTDAATTPAVATNPATDGSLAPAANAGTSAAVTQADAGGRHAATTAAGARKARGRHSQADTAGLPCQSKTASPKPSKSPKVSINPDAGGLMFLPAAAGSPAAEIKAKLFL